MTHGLVVHEPHHIWPILRVRYSKDGGNPRASAFAGTGFVIEGGLFITCWHCVRAPLDEDEAFVAVYKAPNANDTQAGLIALHDLAQDENGTDLALARVTTSITPGLVLSKQQASHGMSVETYGFPLIPPPETRQSDQQPIFDLNARFLRGYTTQVFQYRHPDGRIIDSIESDMPSPEGLSGAPLIRSGSAEVVGVIYGNHSVGTVDTWARIDPETGERHAEVQNMETFSLAHWTETIWKARGPATAGQTVATFHEASRASG